MIPGIKCKLGVKFKPGHLRREVARIIHVAQDTAPRLFGNAIVITSGNDSQHGDGSLHYEDAAFDLRVWNIDTTHLDEGVDTPWEQRTHARAQAGTWASDMQTELGQDYDVVYEEHHYTIRRGNRTGYRVLVGHIHGEWDPDG